MLSLKALGKRRADEAGARDEPKSHAYKAQRRSPVGIECEWEPVSDEAEAASLALARKLQAEENALAERERLERLNSCNDTALDDMLIAEAWEGIDMDGAIECEAYDPMINAACTSKYFAPRAAPRPVSAQGGLWTPPTEHVMEVRYGPLASSTTEASEPTLVEVEQPRVDAVPGSQPTPVLWPPLAPVRPPTAPRRLPPPPSSSTTS